MNPMSGHFWRVLLALTSAVATTPAAVATSPVEFKSTQRSTTFKVDSLDGLIFVPVKINDTEQRWFVLDTGSSRMLIEKKLAQKLSIALEGSGSIGGAGSGKIPIEFARHVRVEMPGVIMPDVEFAAADLTTLQGVVGRPIDGIIGYDFFAANVVTVDYETKTLTVTAPAVFTPPADAERIPVTFDKKWIRVRAALSLPGIATVNDLFLVDSGSQDDADHSAVARASGQVSTQVGNGLGDPSSGALVRANSFRLGKFDLQDLGAATVANEAVGPMIGAGVLHRFHVTYDYSGEQIFLRPNRFFTGGNAASQSAVRN